MERHACNRKSQDAEKNQHSDIGQTQASSLGIRDVELVGLENCFHIVGANPNPRDLSGETGKLLWVTFLKNAC
jgi:hypothetical protein